MVVMDRVLLVIVLATLPVIQGYYVISEYRSEQLDGEINTVNDSTRFQSRHPGLNLTIMNKTKLVKGQINYTLGSRIPGDSLLAEKEDKQSFPSAQDIEIILRYPFSGDGSTLTCVDIIVDQSSNIGDGYIVDGGIAQKFIAVLVQANETLHFSYSASFYGY